MEKECQLETTKQSNKLSPQRRVELEARLAQLKLELVEASSTDAGGKIAINGTFGKLGSCFSKIYAPDLMLGITLTGQFYLLTLIEHLVAIGVTIISANTDGVTFGGTPEKVEIAQDFIDAYGWCSNFEFEYTYYRSISMKDCNNYIAVKTDGTVKAKGIYALSGLQKNPTNEVCTIAAQAYLAKGTPIRETVLRHFTLENFPDFLQVRTVKGGAVEYGSMVTVDDWRELAPGEWQNGKGKWEKRKSRPKPYEVGVSPNKLGRVARWYYSTAAECANGLRYASNDNLVPKSTGGRACMKLPGKLPADVDIQRYIDETIEHLNNMGVYDAK